jgi:hypothetical protein
LEVNEPWFTQWLTELLGKPILTNESREYLAKREELRLAEIEFMLQRERGAELRRHLPRGAAIQDYQFEKGPNEVHPSVIQGDVLSDSEVLHVFTVNSGLIAAMGLGNEADSIAGPSAAFAHRS